MKTKTREVPAQSDELTPAERKAATEVLGERPKRKYTRAAAKGKRQVDSRKRPVSTRATRATEERGEETIHGMADEPWVRPATLPDIPKRKGFVQRWIRTAIRGDADSTNVSRKFREGWKPRRADSLPQGFPVPTIQHGQHAGCIGVEGMLLCEMPKERNEERNTFFRKRNNDQTRAINEQLAQASAAHGSAFGPIKKAERSEAGTLREVPSAAEETIDE